jgi:hypothetical protein
LTLAEVAPPPFGSHDWHATPNGSTRPRGQAATFSGKQLRWLRAGVLAGGMQREQVSLLPSVELGLLTARPALTLATIMPSRVRIQPLLIVSSAANGVID